MALMIVYVQYIYYTFLVLIIFIWLYDTTDVSISMVYPFSQLIGHWCVPKVLPHGLLMLFNVGDFVGLVPWIVTPDDTREWKAQNRGISPHSNVVTYSIWADLWNDYAPTIDVTRTCIIRSWVASIWAISRRFQSVMLHHSTLHFNWKHFETEVPSCCVKKNSLMCDNHGQTVGSLYIFHEHHWHLSHISLILRSSPFLWLIWLGAREVSQ